MKKNQVQTGGTYVAKVSGALVRVRLDTKDFQFLYAEGDDLVFMDVETYD